jgi:hypothetical protein
MRARWLLALGVTLGVATAACSTLLGLDAPPSSDAGTSGEPDSTTPVGDSSTDGTAFDGTSSDGEPPGDAGPGVDTGTPMCTPLAGGTGGTYLPLTPGTVIDDAGDLNWQTFDVTGVQGGLGSAGFTGATFDGRYIYVAGLGIKVGRYDTLGAFDDPGSWSTYNPSPAAGFAGAQFDGRYVYFVPNSHGGSPVSIAARYDTLGDFTSGASWTTFDLSVLTDGGALTAGYYGAAFDGRALFLVPHNDGAPFGRVIRYDTTASADAAPPAADAAPAAEGGTFGDLSSWSTFDTTTISPLARGFSGGVAAAGSLYLAPTFNGAFDAALHSGYDGIVARHVIASGFGAATSWTTFDTTTVNGLSDNYVGCVFDGQFVYFVPRGNAIVLRVDTTATNFATASSWSTYDITRLLTTEAGESTAFAGGTFDGRFVYFVPSFDSPPRLVRYDTQSTFSDDCAWSWVDLSGLPVGDAGGLQPFVGAVFDGQYVYLVPAQAPNPVFVRFLARTPAAFPSLPAFHGSFL